MLYAKLFAIVKKEMFTNTNISLMYLSFNMDQLNSRPNDDK